MKLPSPREHDIQTGGMNLLKYKGWFCFRLNSGVIKSTYKGKERKIFLSPRGTPDTICFKPCNPCENTYDCHVLFVEYKRPGGKTTFSQDMMMNELRQYGAECIVISDLDDLIKRVEGR